jgi:quercetin dioxygenase-like cupin family protein
MDADTREKTASCKTRVLAKSSSSWDGTPLPHYPRTQPEITILRITVPPGMQLTMHRHPVINAGVLLKGQLTVVTEDGRRFALETGDSIVELVNRWHYGMNQGDQPAEIIMFYAGTLGVPVTVEQSIDRLRLGLNSDKGTNIK